MDLGRGWAFLEKLLCSGFSGVWCPVQVNQELRESIAACVDVPDLLEAWLYEEIFQDLCSNVRPQFCSFFNHTQEVDSAVFANAVDYLHDIFTNRYLISLKRLRWIHSLITAAQTTNVLDSGSSKASAFTPVKANVQFNRDDGGRLQGPRKLNTLFGSFEEEEDKDKETVTNPRRQSVTFDKGTKKGTELKDGSALGTKLTPGLDGSYVEERSQGDDQQSIQDSSSNASTVNLPTIPHAGSAHGKLLSVYLQEDEEDMESFIRSPIGGNKKLMASSRSLFAGTASKSLFPNVESSLGRSESLTNSSVSTLHSLNQTSTPGIYLHPNSEAATPISQAELSQISSSVCHMEETPVLAPDRLPTTPALCYVEELPDVQTVFGMALPSRPGMTVYWPSDDSTHTKLSMMMRSVLLSSSPGQKPSFPCQFSEHVKAFYTAAFDVHRKRLDSSHSRDADMSEAEFDQDDRFDQVNKQMEVMGLMDRVSGSAVTEIVHSQIENYITSECKGNFESSFLAHLEQWLGNLVLGWLSRIHQRQQQTASHIANVKALGDRLHHFLYETYGRSLIHQLFDVIIDFPDSKPAILDLCTCLEKTDLRAELVFTLKSALESRLLHPGVNTADILTAYIAAIKALRLLEPAGVILELVCQPVRHYLRSREDTVRCIVASLTDEGSNELMSELVMAKPPQEEHEDDGNMKDWDCWVPDPVDADPAVVSKSRRTADILSTLVNVYGSKELFVNEYRALLADRILMQYNYDEQRELRYLELLKLRFGESQLHFCEVMLRDVTESRRMNARISETKNMIEAKPDDVDMNAMILSAQFWPAFREEKITLPAELQAHLDKYTKSFEAQKQNRTLVWKPHLGIMNIELELNDESLNFSVSPVLAAIIMKFQETTKWSVEDLSTSLEMTANVVRRKISFWQGQGLLKEVAPDLFQLVEDRKGRPQDFAMVEEEVVESAMASAQQQKEEEMQVFWTYIQGMLANLDCLPLERIHSMLRMFGMEEPSSNEITVQELKTFLDNKVKDQVLLFTGGVYKLNKG